MSLDPKTALTEIQSLLTQSQAMAQDGLNFVPPPSRPVFNFMTPLRNVGFKGKGATHVMPWVGEPGHIHREICYSSNDPKVISVQCDNMQAVDIEAVFLTWRGIDANGGWDQQVATLFAAELSKRGMSFAYCLDPNLLKYRTNQSLSVTQEVIRQLTSSTVQAVLHSAAYVPEGFVLDFLTGFHGNTDPNQNVDWNAVEKAIPGVKHLLRNQDYAWPSLQAIADVASVHKSPSMRIPGVAYGFNDSGCPLPYGVKDITKMTGRDYTQSVWQGNDPKQIDPKTITAVNPKGKLFPNQPARINTGRAGSYFLDCVASIAASPSALSSPYVGLVTWNDYDEGTAVEHQVVGVTGIRIGS